VPALSWIEALCRFPTGVPVFPILFPYVIRKVSVRRAAGRVILGSDSNWPPVDRADYFLWRPLSPLNTKRARPSADPDGRAPASMLLPRHLSKLTAGSL